ncbi:CPBP family intramembrane glutamic endopeptidase [Draconibacterium sp. IB214405]|uniref:CPBP family intramembrane glutamic endopeptidase n=1 Tax=Draconibacterium sp. IB214405 TaxID=3097352 RepID=UPI002A105554|nr:CPBP family intramembrane glutamic endopeptidase [Draconibacterium sp. IB214405]MDX8340395.1 CPBP family intramembrane glutamic endopeptidase [Draconibacterium sp. IB214405]
MKHLTRAFDGQNQWWKFLVVIAIALVVGQIVGAIPLIVVMAVSIAKNGGQVPAPDNAMDLSSYGIDPNLGLALMILPFILTLVLGIVLIKSFHERTAKDLVNGGQAFRWKRFWLGVGVWGLIMLVLFFAQLLISPDELEFRFQPELFIPLVFVAVLLIPIQSGTEEFIFRGYLAQGVAGWTKRVWAAILIPSVLFALMHAANPEVKEHGFWMMMPSYFVFGLAFAITAVLDDGIELAIGIHAINNTLGAILVTSKESALQTPSLFFQQETDPVSESIVLVLSSVIMLIIFKLILKWDFSIIWKKIEPPATIDEV